MGILTFTSARNWTKAQFLDPCQSLSIFYLGDILKARTQCLLILAIFMAFSFPLRSQIPLLQKTYTIDPILDTLVDLSPYVGLFVNKPPLLPVDEVIKQEFIDFDAYKTSIPESSSLRHINYRYWLSFTVTNETIHPATGYYLYFGTEDRIFIYEYVNKAYRLIEKKGDEYRSSHGPEYTRYYYTTIDLAPSTSKTYLVHLSNTFVPERTDAIRPYLVKKGYEVHLQEHFTISQKLGMSYTAALSILFIFTVLSLLFWLLNRERSLLAFGLLCFSLFLYFLRDLELHFSGLFFYGHFDEIFMVTEPLMRAVSTSAFLYFTFVYFKEFKYRYRLKWLSVFTALFGLAAGIWFLFFNRVDPMVALNGFDLLMYLGFIGLSLITSVLILGVLWFSYLDHSRYYIIGTSLFLLLNYGGLMIDAALGSIIDIPYFGNYCSIIGALIFTVSMAYLIILRTINMEKDFINQKASVHHLNEINRLKSKLYTNITHEFRTPLTVISGMADQMPDTSSEKILIQRNTENLLDLVNQMLELSKIESGHLLPQLVQMDVVPLLKYLAESYRRLALSRGKEFRVEYLEDTLWMDVDPIMLERILNNLVHNAIKFTPEGGKVQIRISRNPSKSSCLFKVSDTGRGIAPEQLDKIFERFYQVDDTTTRHGEGTGIGLALAKELVQLMKGDIQVESQLNVGSTFAVRMPITKLAPIETWEPRSSLHHPAKLAPLAASTTDDLNVYKILIVEDHADVRHYLRTLMANYILLEADNGRQGLGLAFDEIPDLIISDVMMPEMDGYNLCKNVKTDPRTSHIPVILLTAKSSQEDRLQGLHGGADAYLVKPFDKRELFIRIQNLLEGRKKRQRHYQQFHSLPKEEVQGNEFLKKVREIIGENLGNDDFSIENLARALHLSRTQIYRKLKALTGQSYTALIKEMKIRRAKELLMTSDQTIAEIAYALGFRDQSYFTKVFREETGMTPGEMRS